MPVLRNPTLIKECTDLAASIAADVQFSDASEKDGPDAIEPERLKILNDIAAEVVAFGDGTINPDGGEQNNDNDNVQVVDSVEERLLRVLDGEIERTYRRFYDFVYAELPYCWRQLYTDLSLLKFSVLVLGNARRHSSSASWGSRDSGELKWVRAANEKGKEEGGMEAQEKLLDELVAVLDKALILAGGAGGRKRGRGAIERLLAYLDTPSLSSSRITRSLPASFPSTRRFTPPVTRPIRAVDSMSMSDFQSYLDNSSSEDPRLGGCPEPLVLKSLLTTWPAMTTRPWSSPRYLLSQTHSGRRLVPVEVGRSYVDEGWTQELIPFRELLSRIVAADGAVPSFSSSSSPGGATPSNTREKEGSEANGGDGDEGMAKTTTTYLAQHELFTQLPHLRNDILTPDHCFTSPPPHPLDPSKDKPELDVPLVNAWFGPAGTITPLHTDGYHNLLCQVVGAKYLRLYAPHDSEALCPRSGCGGDEGTPRDDDGGSDDGGGGGGAAVDMSNTSAFDVGAVECWDADGEARDPIELEEFRGLRYWDCVLEAGDVLYIPIGWWHYVRSLSVSFSVSFWWNGDHQYVEDDGSRYDEERETEDGGEPERAGSG